MGHLRGLCVLLNRNTSVWRFQSADCQFGVEINQKLMGKIVKLCARSSTLETGGILTGYYTASHDWAIVTAISGPPPDSRMGLFWFSRGIQGLQAWLNRLWKTSKEYYLGEWHFHPRSSPQPSPVDIWQMQRIAVSEHYACPEPILLVVGGQPPTDWNVSVVVFPARKAGIPLICSTEAP